MPCSDQKFSCFNLRSTSPGKCADSLTKTVPKARIIPNRIVMSTTGAQRGRWKQATQKELQAFLKTACKEPTPCVRDTLQIRKRSSCSYWCSVLKPMTAEKKAQGLVGDEYEKSRICLHGQNHEGLSRIPRPTQTHLFSHCSWQFKPIPSMFFPALT